MLLVVGCATSAPRQTAYMEKQGATTSAEALRVRLRAEVLPITGKLEEAADAMDAATEDTAQHRQILVWKMNAVGAAYGTLLGQRPLAGLADTWALLLQEQLFLESPRARSELGPGVDQAIPVVRAAAERIERTWAWVVPNNEAAARAQILGWVGQHPLGSATGARESFLEYLATLDLGEGASLAAVAGQAAENLDGVVARIDLLPLVLPKLANWQAQLTYLDVVDRRIEGVIERGDAALRRFDDVVGWLGTSGLDAFADRQREAAGVMIDGRIAHGLSLFEAQTEQLMTWAERERMATLDDLRRERVAATAELRRTADELAADASRRAEKFADYVLVRVAILLGAALVLELLVILALRRRRGPAEPQAGGHRPPGAAAA